MDGRTLALVLSLVTAPLTSVTAVTVPLSPCPGRLLPARPPAEVEKLLAELERTYREKDLDGFLALFTDDFEQTDVPRRVHVLGKEQWRTQTQRINSAHRALERVHCGVALAGDLIIAEVEWSGVVFADALAAGIGERGYRYTGLVVMTVRGDKIARQLIYGDTPTLAAHLGVPVP